MVAHDERLPGLGGVHDLQLAAQHHEERNHRLADLDEQLSARGLASPAVGRKARHLLRRERRKPAIVRREAGSRRRRLGISCAHGAPKQNGPRRRLLPKKSLEGLRE